MPSASAPIHPSSRGKPRLARDAQRRRSLRELQTARTFYEWRTKGTGPRCIKLPNGNCASAAPT